MVLHGGFLEVFLQTRSGCMGKFLFPFLFLRYLEHKIGGHEF